MEKHFHMTNRQGLYQSLPKSTVMVSFSGAEIRKTADANYIFFANRNFLYLTGLDSKDFIFLAEKNEDGVVKETAFILPPNDRLEKWTGKRIKEQQAKDISGIENIMYVEDFNSYFHNLLNRVSYKNIALDLYKNTPDEIDTAAFEFEKAIKIKYPSLQVINTSNQLRRQRAIKADCEIDAIKKALTITKAGIERMMQNSKPGMYEYQYKAHFDHALTDNGVIYPAFTSIICSGENNFCIHNEEYFGLVKDGDLILNDVGAQWDNLVNDVSRGWPANGKFSEKQRLLYQIAYDASEYAFSVIKPGMDMLDVDKTIKNEVYLRLNKEGICASLDEVSKYVWHGGAHHIGYDVHDPILHDGKLEPNMVFCVDVGIYHEEWGIGFRLEDNCQVTQTGCVNLSADIPRSIEDIENFMAKK